MTIQCRICQRKFVTVNFEEMLKHLMQRHGGKGGGELFAEIGVLIATYTTMAMFEQVEPATSDEVAGLGEQMDKELNRFHKLLTELIERKRAN